MTEAEIARLIDRAENEPADTRLWTHLRSCRRCFEVYRDSAIYRGLWETGEGWPEPDETLIADGDAIAEKRIARSKDRPPARGRAGMPWHRHPALLVSALASAAALLIVTVVWLGTERAPRLSPDETALRLVREAVETKTRWGPFTFPGAENAIDTAAPIYRSAFVPMTDSLRAALSRLFETYRRGEADVDETYWLVAGYLAVGRLDMAEDLVREARGRFPADPRWQILAEIIAVERRERGSASITPSDSLSLTR